MAEKGDITRAKIIAAWQELIAAVVELENINEACVRAGVTRNQLRRYLLEHPAAMAEWTAAREQAADTCADMVLEIANNPDVDAARARVRMDAYRWLAAKRNPRTYSDKSQLDVNVRTLDLTRIIEAANARLASAPRARILEHNPEPAALLPDAARLLELL